MSTNRMPLERPRRLPLSHDQDMSLRYGDLASRPGFANTEERKAAWFYHRDRLLQHCSGGQRPAGWWEFESPIPYPGRDYAEAALYEAGLLTEGEVAELTSRWRAAFERAQNPRFTYCVGFAKPGDMTATWIQGKAARKAHLKWAGVPRALIRKWNAEYKRRGKIVRELETADQPAA
jgi:hypothetical protein